MRNFRFQPGLDRAKVGEYALPLGVESLDASPPIEGYTVRYEEGEDGEADTYSYQVVVTHERIKGLLHEFFGLLPDDVSPVVEIGSVDAYRSIDVYVSGEPLTCDAFKDIWAAFEPILLEEVSIGAGVTADEPFLEVFLDFWKSITIHCPLEGRSAIEAILERNDLEEVIQTWPDDPPDEVNPPYQLREILLIEDEMSPDLDELLLQLRAEWMLELNIDPDSNVDDAGRELGHTLWHAIAMVEPSDTTELVGGAYVTVWLMATCLDEALRLVEEAVGEAGDWVLSGMYSIERVAFDERPDELGSMPPRYNHSEVLLVAVDEWGGESPRGGPPEGAVEESDDDDDDDEWDPLSGRLSS